MKRRAKHIIKQFVCWILLLQILNVSIDTPDIHLQRNGLLTPKEDLSINEIESVYELVAEGVYGNDMPETDDNDIDTTSESFKLYCFSPFLSTAAVLDFPIMRCSYYQKHLPQVYTEPTSPPPKQV